MYKNSHHNNNNNNNKYGPENPPKAALVTLGCPMNQVDSERMMGDLISRGFRLVAEEDADVIIVNTCGFIDDARQESIETILSLAELKETGRLESLVVTGCLAQRYRDELESELEEADCVLGLDSRGQVADVCAGLLGVNTGDIGYARVVTGPPHTAWLRIAEGCDNRCTYCTIPFIRGNFRSVPRQEILAQAEELASLGRREIILIGQDTTRWGDDIDGCSLPRLLEDIAAVDGIDWIRLMYTHPRHFSDELIEAFAGIDAVLPYIDMPVQHGSDSVLKRMGRRSSAAEIERLIDTLRSRIEGVVLRTSIIVGFPGETETDFQALYTFIERTRFERMGAFPYSPEEGTPAAGFAGQVPAEIAESRHERLMALQKKIMAEFHESLAGTELKMVIDHHNPEKGVAYGRTYMDAPEIDIETEAHGDIGEDGAFATVRVDHTGPYELSGAIV